MNTVALLRRVRDRIASPTAWTQGAAARDAAGRVAYLESEHAVSFCLYGALQREATVEYDNWYERGEAVGYAYAAFCGPIVPFNDAPGRTHAEVLAAVDAAIVRAEAS